MQLEALPWLCARSGCSYAERPPRRNAGDPFDPDDYWNPTRPAPTRSPPPTIPLPRMTDANDLHNSAASLIDVGIEQVADQLGHADSRMLWKH
jgi:hypothetical protein